MVLRAAPDPKEATAAVNGLIRAGGVVVIHDTAARTLCQALLIAERARRLNGLPPSTDYAELIDALHAASGVGQTDVRTAPSLPQLPHEPTVTVRHAAKRLGISERQARRLAAKLGGRKVGNQWRLDEQAIREHSDGRS